MTPENIEKYGMYLVGRYKHLSMMRRSTKKCVIPQQKVSEPSANKLTEGDDLSFRSSLASESMSSLKQQSKKNKKQ